MPVEIRELVIKAVTALETKDDDAKPEVIQSSLNQEAIIQECVRQVMSILKKNEER
jgi:hypothetical protein